MKKSKKRIVLVSILVVLIGILAGSSFFMGPMDKNASTPVVFTISENATTDEIVENLKNENLIRSKIVAKGYIKISGQSDFKVGVFELSKKQSLPKIIKTLNSISNSQGSNVTFLEGYRVIDMAKVAESKLGIKQKDFLKMCNDKDFINELKQKFEVINAYDFNEKEIYQLEGLLAPDTYNLTAGIDAKGLIEVLVAQTNTIYLQNKTLFDKSKLSVNEIYTLASMVEAEAKTYDDRVLVASIFMNRIKNNMSLGSDVTTYYGLQLDMSKRDLTSEELAEDNGYNTRSNMKGLPIGPINAPSNDSVLAALNYEETKYLYFVSDKNGKIYASQSYEKHNSIIEKLKEQGLWFTY
ncbi:UPF0755 protein [Bacilli bacterium PM5-9]|nr:UPF0755 protein [Bacilli bacterium PM5-9]